MVEKWFWVCDLFLVEISKIIMHFLTYLCLVNQRLSTWRIHKLTQKRKCLKREQNKHRFCHCVTHGWTGTPISSTYH